MGTKTLRFEGYSDDTFGEVTTRDDVDNAASGNPIMFRVQSPSTLDSLLVFGQYCPGPATGWVIGVGGVAGDVHLPLWPMRFDRSERPYSPALLIDVPDDATVTHATENDDEG